MRKEFILGSLLLVAITIALAWFIPAFWWVFAVLGPIILLGIRDCIQTKQTIRRNFPFLGRFRYLLEKIRPEMHQYFVESNTEGVPFSREERSLVYQRAKKALDTLPFGTQKNVYQTGYEWVNHSLMACHVDPKSLRVKVGGPDCKQPYDASILNISGMSYGALSRNAILALNGGAKDGDFAHNTGEGGISPYHLKYGGDLIWQIGTGYFGCRTLDGKFCGESFRKNALRPEVKMIEIKLSQGAKPGHGGILPGAKVTPEIAEIRHVPVGEDVLSPPTHNAFSTPVEMMEFIKKLRDLSDGKPIGFKLCLGKRREFLAICKAMHETGITPDFIVVDGAEGGTGAAPLEFSNHLGAPGIESLVFVHNALVGFSLRDRIKIINSGKVISGFGAIKRFAIGADIIYSARAMMLALGCIQALKCNSNDCPTGVATQNKDLEVGLVVKDKRKRVATYHCQTVASVAEMLGAMGLIQTDQLRPWHLLRRTNPSKVHHYGEIFEFLKDGDLLKTDKLPKTYKRAYEIATAESFRHAFNPYD